MSIDPGTHYGPYRIIGPLGAGGMGEVYRAHDTRLGRDVALKVLNAAPDADRLSRFEREARATALLAHPNILTIFDVGTRDGQPFIVTELLDGKTLRDVLVSGPLVPSRAASLALQIARGIAAAHALRVIHRDIKPENLFVTADGHLKILDFGLAKLRAETADLETAQTMELSTPGMVIGTPGYMAPEQVKGGAVDERTDIFALGAVLYELLAGNAPFRRGSAGETFAAVLNERPAALERVPPQLERLVFRCLEKDPADRVQTAAELAVMLEPLRGETPRPGSPVSGGATSIAVLPFLDMSPGKDHDYLCDGIAEELIASLTHIEQLQVTARSTSFQFRDSTADARAVGARLGVDTVLEGGVRKIGERLRITVQLVDVANGYQRWAQRFDGTMDDVFAVQDKIAENVATALRGMLSAAEADALKRPETRPEAYELFLRGRHLMNNVSKTRLMEALSLFERSIAVDPDYAPAHAFIAQARGWQYEWWGGGDAAYEAADRASRRALELAPDLSEAHTGRGAVLSLRGHYQEAADEFEEALRLNPRSFEAHYQYARACYAWGKMERAAALFKRGAEVEPDDVQCLLLGATPLKLLGRGGEAEAMCRAGLERAQRRLELDPNDARALSLGANGLIESGDEERGRAWIARALAVAPDDMSVLVNAACVHARLGDKESALAYLEQSFAKGFGKRDWVENDPDYDILRDDPRFQAMLDKLT